ncbi:MAG: peptidoglycan bridge formation glycyltransferase FemA/FemB family protein [bacterium]|nr:peptidoglycan bridge formation glycyltransferase FemA/FemB family protein [bacterium]
MHDLLQSQGWEQFQQALGRQTHRVGGVLAVAVPLPVRGSYLSCPRAACESSAARALAQEVGACFVRHEGDGVSPRVMRRLVEPQHTWRVALDADSDAMLAAMHEKHRYNIRLAQRRGVAIRAVRTLSSPPHAPGKARGGVDVRDFDACWSLLGDTAQRQRIRTHERQYYETMLDVLPDTHLYFAEREGTALAVAIVTYHGDTATYLHGGSLHEQRQHMAPHLLHWTAMRGAKQAGVRWYDFGGMSLQTDRNKPTAASWEGITRFKQGFGGECVTHPQTRDLIVQRGWYTVGGALVRLRP